MNYRPLLACAAIAMLGAASAASSQEDEEMVIFNTTWVSSDVCNPDIAITVDLLELARDPSPWVGKCVALEGLYRTGALFADSADLQIRGAMWRPEVEGRRVGLYGRDRRMDLFPGNRDDTFVAVGHAGLCEDLWGQYFMVRDYCHSASGPYIALMDRGSELGSSGS